MEAEVEKTYGNVLSKLNMDHFTIKDVVDDVCQRMEAAATSGIGGGIESSELRVHNCNSGTVTERWEFLFCDDDKQVYWSQLFYCSNARLCVKRLSSS